MPDKIRRRMRGLIYYLSGSDDLSVSDGLWGAYKKYFLWAFFLSLEQG